MYDLQKIAQYIAHPEQMTATDMPVFKQLAKEHAYTPVFSMLYLKALSQFDPLGFEKELKHYAYMIPSREVLFDLVHTASEASEELSNSMTVSPEIAPVEELEQREETEALTLQEGIAEKERNDQASEAVEDTPQENVQPPEQTEVEQQEELEEAVVDEVSEEIPVSTPGIEQSEDSSANLPEEKTEEKTERKEYDALEKEILAHAVGASISLEVDAYTEAEELENQSTTEAKVEHELTASDEEVASVEPPEEKAQVDFNQPRSFTEWLSIGGENSEQEEEPVAEALKPEKKSKKNSLEVAPKKEPVTFFSAAAQAKQSLDYTGIPVTETLAKIYDAQGNFPRALEAYEQLILKIPEKKVFFALQIEKLKKKLNK